MLLSHRAALLKKKYPVSATLEDIVAMGSIDINYYSQNSTTVNSLKFTALHEIVAEDPTHNLSFLLKVSRPLSSRIPSWSGLMQQAQKINVSPVVTFDQPLFWKSQQIVSSENDDSMVRKIVLRLGAFHMEMSFVGCIGQLMDNTGLVELLETVYAPNSVSQMIFGKGISRAVRGHLLVDDALNRLLVEYAIPTWSSEIQEYNQNQSDSLDQTEVSDIPLPCDLMCLLENVMLKKIAPESLQDNAQIRDVLTIMTSAKDRQPCSVQNGKTVDTIHEHG